MKASKILAMVLTIALLVAALPTTALAEVNDISIDYPTDIEAPIVIGSSGTCTVTSIGALTVKSGGTLTVESGGTLTVKPDGTLTVVSGGTLTVESGGTLTVESGGTLTLNGGTLDLRGATGVGSSIDKLELKSGNLVVDNEPTVNAQGFVDDIYDYLRSQFNSNTITNITVTGPITLIGPNGILGTLSKRAGDDFWTYTRYVPPEEDKPATRITTTRERSTPLVTFGIYYYRNISAGESFFSWDNGYIQPTTIKIMETIPTRAGYRFLYWTSDPGGDGQRYKPGDAFLLFADVHLYAQWEKTQAAPQPDEDDYNPPSGR